MGELVPDWRKPWSRPSPRLSGWRMTRYRHRRCRRHLRTERQPRPDGRQGLAPEANLRICGGRPVVKVQRLQPQVWATQGILQRPSQSFREFPWQRTSPFYPYASDPRCSLQERTPGPVAREYFDILASAFHLNTWSPELLIDPLDRWDLRCSKSRASAALASFVSAAP